MKKQKRESIRALVRTMYDFQGQRIRIANRLKLKKDGSKQKQIDIDAIELDEDTIPAIKAAWDKSFEIEKLLAKQLSEELKTVPIFTEFLKGVKGCGPLMSAAIISEFDIEKASTVSKMWQFAGLNPGMVRGNKTEGSKKEGTFKLIKSNEMVRGDKLTSGFQAPFNQFLRSKLIGVLASGMIISRSPYAEFYYNYKNRLEQSEKYVVGSDKKWKNESKGHRDMAAKRYMIKMFLKDLYVNWRSLGGLSVRKPYKEEYLGHKHE